MRLKYNSYDGTIINLSKERKIIKHEKKLLKKSSNCSKIKYYPCNFLF